MYKRRLLPLFCCLVYPLLNLQAQSVNTFSSDRPGMANTPVSVGKHYLQMQFGGGFGHYNTVSILYPQQTAIDWNSDFFFRFGLTNKTEFNLGIDLNGQQKVKEDLAIPFVYRSRLNYPTRINGIRAGGRHTFFSEGERDFSLAMLVLLNANQNSFSGNLDQYGYLVSLLGAKQIGSRVFATANIGIQHKDSWTGPELNYVVNLAFDMGYNIGLFIETKNEAVIFESGELMQWYNCGLYWKLTPNFMLDFYGGHNRLAAGAFSENYWYGAMGLSWKIKAIASKKPVTP